TASLVVRFSDKWACWINVLQRVLTAKDYNIENRVLNNFQRIDCCYTPNPVAGVRKDLYFAFLSLNRM
ncbi:MAG: hypothetical protein KDK04_30525, partial [Candidatus Competibacteraceae bacterium]|nr:hypothetical protein [Candidatus Competibacteraceae bacterium]